LCKHKYMIFHW